ncbi:MAG: fibronectin type III domain-containing protein [Chitinivibrionales bacterium]|nr:fibronectin type III domain-containing protein [Chitinivibrionales bacterium]
MKSFTFFQRFSSMILLVLLSVFNGTLTQTCIASPVPQLLEPSTNSLDLHTMPRLRWHSVQNSQSYHVIMSTRSDFLTQSIVLNEYAGDTVMVVSSPLQRNIRYYWHVASRFAADNEGEFSDFFTFTTTDAASPSAQPILVAPGQNADNLPSDSIVFEWQPVANAQYYCLQISLMENFNELFFVNDSASETFDTVAAQFGFAKSYNWRVRGHGKGGIGPWSAVRSLTTVEQSSEKVVLSEPGKNASVTTLTPQLRWRSAARSRNYQVQISTDSVFAVEEKTVFSASTTAPDTALTVSDNVLHFTTAYFWRVRSQNNGGSGPWSDVWKFTAIIVRPTAPVLEKPDSNAMDVSLTPRLQWKAVTAAAYYITELSTMQNFGTLVSKDTTQTTSVTLEKNQLTDGQKYFWRVRAAAVNDSLSPYSLVWCFTTNKPAVAIPRLITPVDKAENVKIPVLFCWSRPTAAQQYELFIGIPSGGSQIEVLDTLLKKATDTTCEVASLKQGTRYLWCVRAIGASDTSEWSNWNQFTTVAALNAPVLVAPASDQKNIDPATVRFIWKKAGNALTYSITVATDEKFTDGSVVISREDISDTTVTENQKLTYDKKYYWRVRCRSATETSPWSGSAAFTTKTAPVEKPQLFSPIDKAIDQPLTVTLAWKKAPAAVSYGLQVSRSATFNTTVLNRSALTDTTLTVQAGLLSINTTYYWRVNASNSASGSPGAWSAVWQFRTANAKPEKPQLAAPANNAVDIAIIPALSWKTVSGVDTFFLQVATTEEFSAPTLVYNNDSISAAVLSCSVPGLGATTNYFWRVRAANNAGQSPWSDVWNFTTVIAPPAAVKLSLPQNAATDIAVDTSVSWQASEKATVYNLQVSRSSNFITTVVEKTGITELNYPLTKLLNGAKYYWRVNATNNGGISAWSETWSFTTVLALPLAPQLSLPANGAKNQVLTVSVRWKEVVQASSYGVQVATSEDFAPASLVLDKEVKNATYLTCSGLTAGTLYYWHVRAVNAAGNGPYSQTWDFTTQSTTEITDSFQKQRSLHLAATLGHKIKGRGIDLTFDGMPQGWHGRLVIYDAIGNTVYTKILQAHDTVVHWNLVAVSGCEVSPGTYKAVVRYYDPAIGKHGSASVLIGVQR